MYTPGYYAKLDLQQGTGEAVKYLAKVESRDDYCKLNLI